MDPNLAFGFWVRQLDSLHCEGSARVEICLCRLEGNLGQTEKGVLALFIVGVQLTLVFMYKFYFFDLL